ncbi:MAG TPA: hypothetical protein VFO39_02245 [Candidatus Sulfotelmatobacter sp.]|nr:hypothetical protein [Candidatus Sulfotelmatobacter sp.]
MQIYNDDNVATRPDVDVQFRDALELSENLKLLGHDTASELARPIKLFGEFRPMQLLDRLQTLAAECNGHAALLAIDRDARCHCFWSYSTDDEFARLVGLKRKGCWIAGFLCFSPDGNVGCYPEPQPKDDAPIFSLLLNTWARLYKADAGRRALDEFVQANKNAADWNDSTLEQFDTLVTQHPDINKTLAVDSSDVNFPL